MYRMESATEVPATDGLVCISRFEKCKYHWVMRHRQDVECPPYLIPRSGYYVGK